MPVNLTPHTLDATNSVAGRDGIWRSNDLIGSEGGVPAVLVPLTTDVRMYFWGHSLIDHIDEGEANDYTNMPIWMNEFAQEAGYAYAVNGAFGFGQTHVPNLPNPINQLSILGVPSISAANPISAADWLEDNINVAMFTPANFRQESPADAVHSNPFWTDITTESTNSLFSFADGANPGRGRYFIYEHWTDMGSHTSATSPFTVGSQPTQTELDAYWSANESGNHQWFIDYHDAMMRDYPALNVKMIPVGYILGRLLGAGGTLRGIPAIDMYEDNAPHGRPSLYFLSGLICYMGVYGVKALDTYTIPANIHADIVTNFSTIIDEIWNILINFRDSNGNTRVFPHELARENLGTNLNEVADFGSDEAFIDLFKNARLIPSTDSTFDTGEAVIVDSDGWPSRIPTGADPQTYRRVRWFWSKHSMWAGGRYVLTWDGSGDFTYSLGISIVSSSGNRAVLDLPPAMEGGIIIDSIDELNHLRNMKLVPEADELTDTIATPFNPAFLATLTIYEAYRFMDWALTNNSEQSDWADRPTESTVSYIDGVPVEVMVKLLNQTQKNGWFCIPHQADDNYVTQMATLVLNTLDSNLSVQVEYSNEVWNDLFSQSAYASAQGNALWGGGETFINRINYYGYRANQVIGLWKTAWSGQVSRVNGVLGAQSDNTITVTEALTCPIAGGGCDANIDQIAIAPYFGNEIGSDSGRFTELESATVTNILDEIESTHLPTALATIDTNLALATSNNLELVAYEGGQHLVWYGAPSTTIDNLFIAANEDPRIESIYNTYFDGWKQRTDGVYVNFSHIGTNTRFGSWSSMEHIQNFYETPRPPKRRALENW